VQEDPEFEACPSEVSETLSQKQNTHERAVDVAQVEKYLPSILEGMGSIPHTMG
jgi:hypothetical protein